MANRIRVFISYLPILIFLLGAQYLVAQPDGKQIFNSNCKACHMMDRNLVGPALDGVFERVQGAIGADDQGTSDWLMKWIKNSQALVQSGDAYAVAIFNEWNKVQMTSFLSLSDEDVLATIDYMRYYNDPVKYPDETAIAQQDQTITEDTGKKGISNNLLLIIIIGSLFIIAIVLTRMTNVLGRIASEKSGEKVAAEKPFYRDKKLVILVLMIIITGVGYWTVNAAIGLGRQQGYAPEQPIKFSHKLHAGINQIDCKYCHMGTEKGKSAIIPSTTVCMNCHKYVSQGPDAEFKKANGLRGLGSDTTEIRKIYAAAGFNPNTQSYDLSKAKSVEWIRIHNLPDHVYFNHAQHVKVGGIECQTCHGKVEEMDIVEQFAPLSMGWCLSCHRETNIKFNDNPYYSNYFEVYHKQLKNNEISGVTVEMIGGADCQKCHY